MEHGSRSGLHIIFIPKTKQIIITKHADFDEKSFLESGLKTIRDEYMPELLWITHLCTIHFMMVMKTSIFHFRI